jgi:choline transport protein
VTFQFALTNGGPASIFYGSLLAGAGACAVGFSLAELASMYVLHSYWVTLARVFDNNRDPTVGAQYRWSANLAPAAPRFWGLLQGE